MAETEHCISSKDFKSIKEIIHLTDQVYSENMEEYNAVKKHISWLVNRMEGDRETLCGYEASENNIKYREELESIRICLRQAFSREIELNERYKACLELNEDDMSEMPLSMIWGYALSKGDKSELLGDIFGRDANGNAFLPLSVTSEEGLQLMLHGSDSDAVLEFTYQIIWAFISQIPANMLNVCVMDMENQGGSLGPFLKLRKRSPSLFDGDIITRADSIRTRLEQFGEQISDYIQNKQEQGDFSIFDYDRRGHGKKERINLLVIYDFPKGFSDHEIQLLNTICRKGNACGIYTVICDTRNGEKGFIDRYEDAIRTICEECRIISCEKEGVYTDEGNQNLIAFPGTPYRERNTDKLERLIQNEVENSCGRGIEFKDILPKEMFSESSDDMLRIPMGCDEAGKIVYLEFGRSNSTAHHGLIIGATGSGKSVLLHTVISCSMYCYSPEELQLYLMDFKTGTEFSIYEKTRMPHIRLLALDAKQEFGESILEELEQEMQRRAELFKDNYSEKLSSYNEKAEKKLPRILVIIDEFQIMYDESLNRNIAQHCADLTNRIVKQGRSYGIHLLMAAQSAREMSGRGLAQGVIDNINTRIGLLWSPDDTQMLFRQEYSELEEMRGNNPGSAVLASDYTVGNDRTAFKVAFCERDQQGSFLEEIQSGCKGKWENENTRIFEGRKRCKLSQYIEKHKMEMAENRFLILPIGEPIKVGDPVVITLDKKVNHNIIICGSDEERERLIIKDCIISSSLRKDTNIVCIDGNFIYEDEETEQFYESLKEDGLECDMAEGDADIIQKIKALYDKFETRKKSGRSKEGATDLVIIRNLQLLGIIIDMLHGKYIDEKDYIDDSDNNIIMDDGNPFSRLEGISEHSDDKTLNASEKLLTLISMGYRYRIHFIMTSLDYGVLKKMRFDGCLDSFPIRIVYSMDEKNASDLIDGVSLDDMDSDMACYKDEKGGVSRMKVYDPSDIDLQGIK